MRLPDKNPAASLPSRLSRRFLQSPSILQTQTGNSKIRKRMCLDKCFYLSKNECEKPIPPKRQSGLTLHGPKKGRKNYALSWSSGTATFFMWRVNFLLSQFSSSRTSCSQSQLTAFRSSFMNSWESKLTFSRIILLYSSMPVFFICFSKFLGAWLQNTVGLWKRTTG